MTSPHTHSSLAKKEKGCDDIHDTAGTSTPARYASCHWPGEARAAPPDTTGRGFCRDQAETWHPRAISGKFPRVQQRERAAVGRAPSSLGVAAHGTLPDFSHPCSRGFWRSIPPMTSCTQLHPSPGHHHHQDPVARSSQPTTNQPPLRFSILPCRATSLIPKYGFYYALRDPIFFSLVGLVFFWGPAPAGLAPWEEAQLVFVCLDSFGGNLKKREERISRGGCIQMAFLFTGSPFFFGFLYMMRAALGFFTMTNGRIWPWADRDDITYIL